jgi:hypothetical protein
MRVKNLLLVAGTAFVALGAIEMPSVHAAPIPITNPSFEQPSLPKGSFTIENITGWSVINTGTQEYSTLLLHLFSLYLMEIKHCTAIVQLYSNSFQPL